MTFRLRLALAAALAVATTVAAASAVVYVVMRNELRSSIDQQLQQQAQQVLTNRGFLDHAFDNRPFPVPQQGPSATAMYLQLVGDNGFTQLGVNETDKVPVSKLTIVLNLGAIVGGVLAGLIAHWIASWRVPAWARGLMPVLVNRCISASVR